MTAAEYAKFKMQTEDWRQRFNARATAQVTVHREIMLETLHDITENKHRLGSKLKTVSACVF